MEIEHHRTLEDLTLQKGQLEETVGESRENFEANRSIIREFKVLLSDCSATAR